MAASDTEWLLPMLTPKPVKNQSADENRLQWDVLHTFQTIRGALDAFAFYQLFAKNHPLPTATTWQPRVELGLDLLSGLRTITATCKIENGAAYFWIQAIYDELAQRRSASAGN